MALGGIDYYTALGSPPPYSAKKAAPRLVKQDAALDVMFAMSPATNQTKPQPQPMRVVTCARKIQPPSEPLTRQTLARSIVAVPTPQVHYKAIQTRPTAITPQAEVQAPLDTFLMEPFIECERNYKKLAQDTEQLSRFLSLLLIPRRDPTFVPKVLAQFAQPKYATDVHLAFPFTLGEHFISTVEQISRKFQISHVTFTGCDLCVGHLNGLLSYMPTLRSLILEDCSTLNLKGDQEILYPASLTCVALLHIPFDDDGLRKLFTTCRQLHHLELVDCEEVTFTKLNEPYQHSPLNTLIIDGCKDFLRKGSCAMEEHFSALTSLKIANVHHLDERSALSLPKTVKTLNLTGSDLHVEDAKALARAFSHITTFNFTNCPNLPQELQRDNVSLRDHSTPAKPTHKQEDLPFELEL